jgi:arginyl-tRNA synthetase
MDRVLRRRDGRLTYIASDVAYHKDKFNRPDGADKLITVLGPDHHGYIGRLTAVVAAMLMEKPKLGTPIDDEVMAKLYKDTGEKEACDVALAKAKKLLEVQIYQLVRFVKDGKPAPMRKRDGNIYALIDLMKEIGVKLKPEGTEAEQLEAGRDVSRFFYLMRSHDTTFDFDLDLAEKQSDENPVFYVQYAHARICSVLQKAEEALGSVSVPDLSNLLVHDREKSLIKKIVDLPDEVRRASDDYGVHRIATYGIELARSFHYFYDGCRVIQADQPELSAARMKLCEATKQTLKTTLDLLGVSAPEKM